MIWHDNGDLFWPEGSNCSLGRYCSPAEWVALPLEWKIEVYNLCVETMDNFFSAHLGRKP